MTILRIADEIELFDELDMAARNWTHAGCIQLGSQCLDVFADQNGDLWVCRECTTTRNPGRVAAAI